MKTIDKPVPVIPTASNTSLKALFQTTQVAALAPPPPHSLAQNQGLSPGTIHPCSLSSNVSVPNAVNQVRVHPPGYVVPRYKPRSPLLSLQSLPTSNSNVAPRVASRDKSHHVGSRSSQSFLPCAVFKRHGLNGALPNNRHAYSQLSRDPSLRRCRAFQTPVMNVHSSNEQNIGSQAADSVIPQPKLSSSHSMNIGRANYLPSQPQIHSRPYSSCLSRDPIQCQSQMPSQPYVNRNFVSAVPLQPNVSSQPSVENIKNLVLPQPHVVFQPNNPVPSQTVASYQSDAGSAFGDQLHSRSMISSHPNVNNFENHSSQPQGHNNPTSSLIDGQNDVQRGNHTQNSIDVSPTDFGFFWDSSLNHGNLQVHAEGSQYQSTAPAETSQLQNIPKNDNHPSIAPVDNFPQQSVVLADYTSPINDAECTEPDSLDFPFDSWTFEDQSLSGALEVSVSPNWNVFSPEPASIDTGTLFDIQVFRE